MHTITLYDRNWREHLIEKLESLTNPGPIYVPNQFMAGEVKKILDARKITYISVIVSEEGVKHESWITPAPERRRRK